MKLCTIDYDTTFATAETGDLPIVSILDSNNCTFSIISLEGDSGQIVVRLNVTSTVSIDLCELRLSFDDLSDFTYCNGTTDAPKDIKNVDIEKDGSILTVSFSSFEPQTFSMSILIT